MNAPVPRDPRRPRVDGAELSRAVDEILAEPATTLREEAEHLRRAHALLNDALQTR
ncbi:hypothetical protein [Corynebacterium timonense]|uniref:Uncharacterized protein n=1 Tax=Corynebacterium timonense TaxID=441500 RepID=A0A1H1PFN4_9CORY|nr:hypothetical protein [Corynebacterium timonense]SDS10076.1 hypothetical protein SAMN04488539_1005 [Corynebacterium timonense]